MIKINGKRWKIRVVSPSHPFLTTSKNTYTLGCCDIITQTIYISAGLTKPLLKKVLCHELVHAELQSYNIALDYEEEEIIADIISTHGEEIISLTNLIYKRLK